MAAANTLRGSWSKPAPGRDGWECYVPSGGRRRRADSWGGRGMRGLNHKVEINYEKLKELCLHRVPVKDGERQSRRERHDHFMAEYSSIFNTRKKVDTGQSNGRKHSCNDEGEEAAATRFDITTALINIHGRDKRQQEIVDLNSRLKAMLKIVKKPSVQRSSSDVTALAQHLTHFPGLLPRMEGEVLVGVASRAKMEIIPKNSIGYSLPDKGGVYIILQGCVDASSSDIISETLEAGEFFGELTPTGRPQSVRSSAYPSYGTKGPCTLMRLTSFNYERVLQTCQSVSFNERRDLIRACHLLHSVSPSVITKLAEAITWDTIEAGQILLSQGEEVTRVGFIQSGSCIAYVNVPRAPKHTQVTVGNLGRGNCIGEVILRGNDLQPFTIISTTRLRVGWVSATTLRVNEVEKHILSDKEFMLKILSADAIRFKYARKLMDEQWRRIREDIVQSVVTERGIQRGHSKWKHSRSHSQQ